MEMWLVSQGAALPGVYPYPVRVLSLTRTHVRLTHRLSIDLKVQFMGPVTLVPPYMLISEVAPAALLDRACCDLMI